MTTPTATVLVIEDNPITRKMIRVALASEGYKVVEAADGQAALEQAACHSPDLVLQDLILPDVDGLELVQQLRTLAALATVPILAISGLLSKIEQARAIHAGFTDYLFKPVEPSHLLPTIQAYLRPAGSAHGKPGAGRRILIADDDPRQLKLLKIQLEQLGFVVTTAADGVEALAQAQACPPDALITDVLMPQLDGFQLCLAARRDARLARVPVLLTSAVYTDDRDAELARTVGASRFLLRQPGQPELAEALLACLDGSPPSEPGDTPNLPMEDYVHRVIRQLEGQVNLCGTLTRRLALLEAELGILARMVETLKRTVAVDKLLDDLLYHCLDAAGISRGATFLLEPDGRLVLRASLGYPNTLEESLTEFFGHGDLLRQVIAQGEPLIVRQPSELGDGSAGLHARGEVPSLLLTPLVLGEQCLGVLGLASTSRELGEDWISFAKVVGSQLAQAVELARSLSRLSASERRYRDLVENLDAIVWEADAQTGQFTFVNKQAERLLGYPVAQWLTEPDFWVRHLHAEDREQTIASRRAAIAAGEDLTLEYRMRAADGRTVWIQAVVGMVRDVAGAVRQLRGLMVDITARKLHEEQETELRVARQVQQRLYPTTMPKWPGFDIAGASYPAAATGGDHFDFLPMGDDALGVVIGDVSGHGLGPALLMAETRAYLRALGWTQSDVSALLTLANRALDGDIPDRFVTLLMARLDPATRSLTYASAGHQTGYVLDATGTVKTRLEATSPPLGVVPDLEVPAGAVTTLKPGDLVLFLTDGIVEARNPDGQIFGEERALALGRIYRSESAAHIVENLYWAVRTFSHNLPQIDDLTAVAIKVERN
jgi:PAS domain S-box-containing protein